ncbi:UNVERIFIED_CONTAM: hypothetical protein K2H54_048473 [Gekko kuhli]
MALSPGSRNHILPWISNEPVRMYAACSRVHAEACESVTDFPGIFTLTVTLGVEKERNGGKAKVLSPWAGLVLQRRNYVELPGPTCRLFWVLKQQQMLLLQCCTGHQATYCC